MMDARTAFDNWLRDEAARMRSEADAGASPKGETLTVRQFIARFGYSRRGLWMKGAIRDHLDSHGLHTSPDFESEHADNPISIELVDNRAEMEPADPTVRVEILPAARNEPKRVAPDARLVEATTLMRLYDYSQLPVMTTDSTVKGAVSWRSVGEAYAQGHCPEFVRDCMEEAHEIKIDETLANAADRICRHDYVLIRDKGKITGIVTAADLAIQFRQHAYPFLLVEEIELHLRNLVRGRFTVGELRESSDGGKEIFGPSDLTLGGYCRLLEKEENWGKIEFNADRKAFLDRLDEARRIRNSIVHFSLEDQTLSDIEPLENLANFFRKLERF